MRVLCSIGTFLKIYEVLQYSYYISHGRTIIDGTWQKSYNSIVQNGMYYTTVINVSNLVHFASSNDEYLILKYESLLRTFYTFDMTASLSMTNTGIKDIWPIIHSIRYKRMSVVLYETDVFCFVS